MSKAAIKVVLALSLFLSANIAFANPPYDTPPRGRAYGYYLKDGERALFIYMVETATWRIELTLCRPNRVYTIESTTDLKNWQPLATVRTDQKGTASITDTRPEPHCFFRVKGRN